MAESEEVVAISTPSLSKSDVWMHFGHPVYLRNDVRVTDKQHTICKLCKTILKHTGNTTNMRTHMTRHHGSVTVGGIKKPASFSTVATTETKKPKLETTHKTETQPKVASMFAKQTKYPASSQRAQIITRQIATYIVADMRPLSIVENKEFKRLLEIMDPQYSLPSRKHFSDKVIAGLYVETKNTVMNQLKGALSVSLTTDSWTSRATQSYMTVTAHYVSQDWKMHNHVLTTRMLSEAHTGENLGNALKDVVMEWQLERATQIPVVSDNASNMDIAAKTAGLHPHIKCFAHTINLASQRGLKVNAMARLLGRIRRIVAFFHKSTTATNVLASKQILLEIPRHKLVNDVATRWNSSYEMVERFLEQQPAILCALTSNEVKRNAKDIVTLSDGDINESQNAVELLKPMKVATAIMCDEHHPTVSLIFPLKTQILQSMTVKDGDSTLVKEVKNAITEDLVKRYTSPDIEDFLLLTSALDPRFRSLPQLDDARRNQVYDSLHMKAVSFSQQQVIVKAEKTENMTPAEGDSHDGLPALPRLPSLPDMDVEIPGDEAEDLRKTDPALPIESSHDPPKPVKTTAMEDFFGDVYVVSATPGLNINDRVSSEIRQYRCESIPVTENPLEWWRDNRDTFPLLSAVAMSLLSIPGTSVPSERVFSTAGDIVTATRSCLDPDLVDKLIFLKKNI